MRDQIGSTLQIFNITVLVGAIPGQSHGEVIAQREIECTFDNLVSALTCIYINVSLSFISFRFGRDNVHRTTNRIPAEHESLGSA